MPKYEGRFIRMYICIDKCCSETVTTPIRSVHKISRYFGILSIDQTLHDTWSFKRIITVYLQTNQRLSLNYNDKKLKINNNLKKDKLVKNSFNVQREK